MSRSLDDLVPLAAAAARDLIQRCASRGIRLGVTHTLRTAEEQDALYAQGRTRSGPIVTYARAGQSWHNTGRAFDVVILRDVDGDGDLDADWDATAAYDQVGELGERCGLEWGGRWLGKKRDALHFQLTDGLTIEQAMNRKAVIR